MLNFYTPSTNGLYEFEDNGYDLIANGTVLPDSISITDSLLLTLRAGVAAGQMVAVVNGVPELVPAPVVPLTCTPGQFDMALQAMGLLTAVQSYVAASSDPTVGIAYNKATYFAENDAFVTSAAAAMGHTKEDTHQMFVLANTFNL